MEQPHDRMGSRGNTITGRCEHCEWYVVVDSYPAVVEAYQDHLRERHPKLWLRT